MSEPTDSLGRETSSEEAPQTVDDFAEQQGNLTDEDDGQTQQTVQDEQDEGEQRDQPN